MISEVVKKSEKMKRKDTIKHFKIGNLCFVLL